MPKHSKEKTRSGVKLVGHWGWQVRNEKGEVIREGDAFNIVPDVGLAAIADQFGLTTLTRDIGDNLYIAVGDDATTVAASDTTLTNETARKAQGSRSSASGVASVVTFFAAGEATGTHREFGLFGDGGTTQATSSADTGILYSHVNVNVSVGATETLTVTFELTFSR